MKTVSLFSIKGGVGKTSAAVNIAWGASRGGRRTLLVDLDPQAAAGFYFRVKAGKKSRSDDLLGKKKKVLSLIRESDYPDLDILPAKEGLRNIDRKLDGEDHKREVFDHMFSRFKKDYDLLVIDSPPHFGLSSENLFRASDSLLVPIIPTTLSIRTLEQLIDFFKRKDISPSKLIAFYSMVDRRKKLHREIADQAARDDISFLSSSIPLSSDVEQMGLKREPVLTFSKSSKGGKAFEDLIGELIEKGVI
jgi:chromosome partitioning protein